MLLRSLGGRSVRLRPLDASDRARIVEIRRTAAVAQWWPESAVAAEFSADLADDELHQFAIELSSGRDGEGCGGEGHGVVGMIQFAEETDPQYRHASIDLYVDPAVHRRGVATDAITTLADWLFDHRGHHRLVIDPSVDNHAAIACYRKVGFRPVGVMRAYERRGDGTWGDGLLMDMLASDRLHR